MDSIEARPTREKIPSMRLGKRHVAMLGLGGVVALQFLSDFNEDQK
jgi:hypothetical protein